MAILAVDTACGTCSVALADMRGALLAEAEETEAARQAERLVPMIQGVLAQRKLSYADLELLVSTVGPGSFTGLRIGMTAIKGIALVTGLPVMGVNTLETIAQAVGNADLILLNALRGQVYAQKFKPGVVPASEPLMIDIADIPTLAQDCSVIGGNCTAIVKETLPKFSGTLLPDALPRARDAAALAAARFAKGQAAALDPLYIRKPDAKIPQQKRPA